eukprot:TRINITY_DN64069_c0_g1_i1.p2 TRINITY_DN64069_c0_g1~~TRINITY_DN64069_c0_g1_i1.p2  ORF type:complete len:211 (-),score=8.68 TRINITY_DN64069_c0_g1_i1:357-989(-)
MAVASAASQLRIPASTASLFTSLFPRASVSPPQWAHRRANLALTSSSARVPAVRAAASPDVASADSETVVQNIKEFLADLKSVGRVRLIVNTGMGVLESVTTLDGLFYHALPAKGEYANVIKAEENVDFHLLLSAVSGARLVVGKSMRGDFPTYTIRFLNAEKEVGASVFVMWKPGTMGDYDEGQVEAFQALVAKYGEEIAFSTLAEYDI